MLSEELVDTGKNNVFAMNSFLYLAFFPPSPFLQARLATAP